MENIHDEAARLGVERPELQYREYFDQDQNRVVGLTTESDKDWSDYMVKINMARLALRGV